MNDQIGVPLRLAHLPILMDVLRRTKILDVIDVAVADDPRSKVSTSDCVAVMLCSIFAGAHDLWRVRERLERFDMATAMQDPGFSIQEFPEERLAKALDDLWKVDVNKLMTAIALQTIDRFYLDLFAQVQIVPITTPDGKVVKHLAGYTDVIARACAALGTTRREFEPGAVTN